MAVVLNLDHYTSRLGAGSLEYPKLLMLQVGFAVFMELGIFPYVSLVALIPFLQLGIGEA
ncbi:MAG: hypothetical protein M2R45_01902 [Verrucomicrobia subdivision 3 bacterium]|nr:hypothetical protein [Limisphaerales bacterium]MCS1415700.1 hypothetical protein [Limisphaerales bacterium]